MSRSRAVVAILAGSAAVLVLAAVALYAWGHRQYVAPGPLAASRVHVIPKGAALEVIAGSLADAGIIRDPLIFELGVRLSGTAKRLRAGEYAFPAGASAELVAAIMVSGATVQHKITVAEGLTTAQIIAELRAADVLEGEIGKMPGEGELLPDTYHVSRGDTRAEIVARMRTAMDQVLDELWPNRAANLPLDDRRQAVTLASIIEKETAVETERRRIAGVFVNRLRRGMRLQSDPTVIYGITNGAGPLDRPLMNRDLEAPTPYNTYINRGLPPGPIANPGRAAIAAALDPLPSKELYFVADGSGGHAFAETLEEHNRNVARWRRLQRSQRQAQ